MSFAEEPLLLIGWGENVGRDCAGWRVDLGGSPSTGDGLEISRLKSGKLEAVFEPVLSDLAGGAGRV